MSKYVDEFMEYLPVLMGAAAGAAVLASGVSKEISDILAPSITQPSPLLETMLSVTSLFAAAIIGENIKDWYFCNQKKQSDKPYHSLNI